jgi:hypothetical protein
MNHIDCIYPIAQHVLSVAICSSSSVWKKNWFAHNQYQFLTLCASRFDIEIQSPQQQNQFNSYG